MTDVPASSSSWQKSSYCAQGEACVYVAAACTGAIELTESGDPTGAILHTTPAAWAALVRALKESRPHG
ncbi:DUF397 domain-containing protein [Streptomyces sp. Ncost-T10-10d]|uniref:DUF397 domain-containing protein n=1 Tax=Streptomyces sp. Ncost-T10-10d TaxID=1839774 RepID=UPI00081DFAF3|nr:DUF397 domain-containing protein [Streptomyces sp. Ncost-T10-10d]SCF94279.1 protein of unknown function [Streptomyces sp. Ncost-T10-10d]